MIHSFRNINGISRQVTRIIRRTLIDGNEYAFEMASSTTRFGRGVSREVGHDLQAMGVTKNVCLMTDKHLVNLPPVKIVSDALRATGIEFEIFDDVQVEPTDVSLKRAIDYAKKKQFSCFVAVGGGSVIDTAKAANLYMCHPEADFLDFVNAPIGKGQPVNRKLAPLIAIPTTAGTGSETTGVAIFDHMGIGAKTGIRWEKLLSLFVVCSNFVFLCLP
jgi:hydroxyacid-oxoacid transhydrogenase